MQSHILVRTPNGFLILATNYLGASPKSGRGRYYIKSTQSVKLTLIDVALSYLQPAMSSFALQSVFLTSRKKNRHWPLGSSVSV